MIATITVTDYFYHDMNYHCVWFYFTIVTIPVSDYFQCV